MAFLAAAVQFEPTWGRRDDNLAALLELSKEAVAAGARLVAWPEMATTGYIFESRAEIAPYVEPVPGPTTERVAAFCRANDVHVAIGLAEVDPETDLYYNTAVLVDNRGRIAGTYRKTHLWIDDTRWAAAGSAVPAWDTQLGRVAMLICRDADFPEAARLAARQGAEVVLHLTNWLGPAPSPAWRARARENGVFWIATARWGEERGVRFSGGSSIIGPDGSVLDTRDGGNGLVLATVDPGAVRAERLARESGQAEAPLAAFRAELALNPHLYPAERSERPAAAVAVVQASTGPSTPEQVRAALEPHLTELAAAGRRMDLVVVPSLVDPDDVRGARDVAAWAEPLPGPSTDWLLEWARRLESHVATTVLEWADGDIHLTALIMGPEGVALRHRSVLLPPEALAWCTPGRGFDVCDLPFGRVGLLSALELAPPEPARILALRGCRVIAATGGGRSEPAWLASQRALENQVFLALAQRSGGGGSFVFGDAREEAARAPLAEPGSHVYAIPPEAPWVDDKSLLRMRPTVLYEALCRTAPKEAPRAARRRAGRP